MRKKIITLILMMESVLCAGCGTGAGVVSDNSAGRMAEQEEASESFDPEKISPRDDFNGYVNAKYLMEADISENRGSFGSFMNVSEKVDEQLDKVIDGIVKGKREEYAPGSNEQLIYDVYEQTLAASTGGSFMNEEDVEEMRRTVESIWNTSTMDEFLDVCGTLYSEWGVDPICGAQIESDMHDSTAGSISIQPFSNPTGMSMKHIMLGGTNAQFAAAAFRSTLMDLGMDKEEAKARSLADAQMIIDIAMATDLERLEMISKDMSMALQTAVYKSSEEIDELCPNIGYDGLLRTMGLGRDMAGGVYLWDEGQLGMIDSLLDAEHLKQWQDMAVLCYMVSISMYLPEEYGGVPILYSNDLYARDGVKMTLPKQLGEEYVKKYRDEETVEDVKAITKAIVDEYRLMIKDSERLSAGGRKAIGKKLENMAYFIGADEAHEVDTSDAELVGHSVYDTVHRLNLHDFGERKKLLSDGVERNGFASMPPQMVNACYIPDMNAINITLAIMNEPFYSKEQSYWQNLGGIGAVVGHEISHAFDDHGMLYDMNGNYDPGWISEEDREAFEELTKEVEAYYSTQKILEVHSVDGEHTLGENLADISGMDCILRLTENNGQRKELFENYARIWAGVEKKDDVLEKLYLDVHSPGKVRVNAVVALFDPFYEIYDVKEGDAMYVAPEARIKRW